MDLVSVKSTRHKEKRRTHSSSEHMSPAQKVSAVLRLLKGETLEMVGGELGVSVRHLERWQSDFLAAGASAMAKRKQRTFYSWLGENSGVIVQWLGLLLALVVTTALLAFLIRSCSQE